jgi:hypothetical protein
MMVPALFLVFCAGFTVAAEPGRHIYVHPQQGDDHADGLSATAADGHGPVRSIAQAVHLAQPGDTVDLAAVEQPYKESAVFTNRSGEPGRPIVLDGHGATLSGCEPLNVDDWKMVAPGRYRTARLPNRPSQVGRFYFLFDGVPNHMGRSSKGVHAPFKKPDDLKPGEWTFVQSEGAYYIQIDPARSLADCRVEAPVRLNGVQISGKCSHLVIRNLTATHVYNDGYNIHGTTRDIAFENITAIECGDDGLSAHDDCEIRVDGFVSIRNSTGECNIGNSRSTNNRLLIKENTGRDFYMLGSNTHTLTNSTIYTSNYRTIDVAGQGKADDVCTLKLDNVVVHRDRSATPLSAGKNSVVEINGVTLDGIGMDLAGRSAVARNSKFEGTPASTIRVAADTRWTAEGNVYGVESITVGEKAYTAANFDAYRQATGQDKGSKWEAGKK